MREIHFGMIGCGWITCKTYLPILQSMENVRIISVFDHDWNQAEAGASAFHIPHFCADEAEFWDQPLDAVIITTPNHTHAAYALKALNRNMHVICEKPTVVHMAEYAQLANTAEQRNLHFIPAFVNRFRTDVAALRAVNDSGEIGEINSIHAGWIRKNGYPRPGSWFTNKAFSGGGVLMDLGPHVLDICLELLAHRNITTTQLRSWYEDGASVHLADASAQWYQQGQQDALEIDVETTCQGEATFEGGKRLDFTLSWNAPVDHDYTCFVIHGSRGTARLNTLFGFSTNRMTDFNELIIEQQDAPVRRHVFHSIQDEQMDSFRRLCAFVVEQIRSNEPGMKLAGAPTNDGELTVRLIEELYKNEFRSGHVFGREDFAIGT